MKITSYILSLIDRFYPSLFDEIITPVFNPYRSLFLLVNTLFFISLNHYSWVIIDYLLMDYYPNPATYHFYCIFVGSILTGLIFIVVSFYQLKATVEFISLFVAFDGEFPTRAFLVFLLLKEVFWVFYFTYTFYILWLVLFFYN